MVCTIDSSERFAQVAKAIVLDLCISSVHTFLRAAGLYQSCDLCCCS